MRLYYTLLRHGCLILALFFNGLARAEPISVNTYNTYLFPPYLAQNGGLAADLVTYLNQKLLGEYRLQLINMPRSRLVRSMIKREESLDGIVLFLNPRFVDDANQQHFLWTPALFKDQNVLIFRKLVAPTEIKDLKTLQGMRFGAILENRYKDLDDMNKAGVITRIDGTSELFNLNLLQANRIDFTQLANSTFTALYRENLFAEQLVALPIPGDPPFTRHILINKKQPELAKRLITIVTNMASDPIWRETLKPYQLDFEFR
ncbi:substrate-binding periplasmic protein [Chitinimonas sp. PSY-7]|uniref:substrate-binding periplasmic protein n=1 Tax=Chitinimonas sp. PSY-7 TaxID=3459088 RepID=UPI00403FFE8D